MLLNIGISKRLYWSLCASVCTRACRIGPGLRRRVRICPRSFYVLLGPCYRTQRLSFELQTTSAQIGTLRTRLCCTSMHSSPLCLTDRKLADVGVLIRRGVAMHGRHTRHQRRRPLLYAVLGLIVAQAHAFLPPLASISGPVPCEPARSGYGWILYAPGMLCLKRSGGMVDSISGPACRWILPWCTHG